MAIHPFSPSAKVIYVDRTISVTEIHRKYSTDLYATVWCDKIQGLKKIYFDNCGGKAPDGTMSKGYAVVDCSSEMLQDLQRFADENPNEYAPLSRKAFSFLSHIEHLNRLDEEFRHISKGDSVKFSIPNKGLFNVQGTVFWTGADKFNHDRTTIGVRYGNNLTAWAKQENCAVWRDQLHDFITMDYKYRDLLNFEEMLERDVEPLVEETQTSYSNVATKLIIYG